MKNFRVGVDSYSLEPLDLTPFEALEWAAAHGAEGIQFSGLRKGKDPVPDAAFCRDLAQAAAGRGLYVEWGGGRHIPFDLETWKSTDIAAGNRAAAEQARALGVRVIRSCSGGLMRWNPQSPPTGEILAAMVPALAAQKDMLLDLGVVLAIELHFEFTTFELLRLFDMCGAEPGGWLGVCLDTMNPLTMLEDPVAATERVLPWIEATHVKDGAVLVNDEGLVSFTAEAGTGLVDLKRIFELLSTLDRDVNLSLEDHGGSFDIPVYDPAFLSRFPDLTAGELEDLERMAREAARRGLEPLARADWPRHCEARVVRGIENVRRIVRAG